MNYSYQGFTWKIFSNIYVCMYKVRLYQYKNVANSKNIINIKKEREAEKEGRFLGLLNTFN